MPLPQFSALAPAKKQLAIDMFCDAKGYRAQIEQDGATIPNPETKAQFVNRLAQEWIVQQALAQYQEVQSKTVKTAFD